jgi:hypothetical protein
MEKIKLNQKSSLRGVDRKEQITRIENCVFFVKAFSK